MILQYTSGSTSEPKGVMIPDRALGANIDACLRGRRIDPDDVIVSWLPLYHDMGLVGLLGIPMLNGIDLVQATPQDFLAHPGHWMEWMSATAARPPPARTSPGCWRPRRSSDCQGLDLSPMRIALNGAEPVDPAAVEAFVAAAEPFGFRPGAVFPAFGMAEVAIGGSFPPPMRGLVCDTVDREVLERTASPSRSTSRTRTTRR